MPLPRNALDLHEAGQTGKDCGQQRQPETTKPARWRVWRKAVLGMLADAPDWSDRAIAKHVGVSDKTVGSHREAICGNSPDAPPTRTVERNGKTYTQNVAGQKAAAKPPKRASQANTERGEVESDSTQEPSGAVQVAPEVKSDFTLATDPNADRLAELEQMAANLHRRQLSAGQKAAIVASAQDWANAQTRGGDRGNQHGPSQSQAVDFDSVAKRSAASGASRVTQMKADKVAKADPALSRQVALVGSLTVFRTQ